MVEKREPSSKPANIAAAIVFILCTGLFSYTGVQNWLPFLVLNLGIAVIVRQMLLRNHVDTIVMLVLFGAAFVSTLLGFFAVVFLPAIFIIAAVYFIVRQFFSFKSTPTKAPVPAAKTQEVIVGTNTTETKKVEDKHTEIPQISNSKENDKALSK